MNLLICLIEDRGPIATGIEDAIREAYESDPAAQKQFAFVYEHCISQDPLEALKVAVGKLASQPFLVTLDLHFKMQLPNEQDAEAHKFYGLTCVYEGMNRHWRNAGESGARPWRHAFIVTRLLGDSGSPQHEARIKTLARRFSIPKSHIFEIYGAHRHGVFQRMAREVVSLANKYAELVGAGRAADFECDCLPP